MQNRKNHIRLSPYSLAVLSEKQNRKKHNLTIASLAIGGILFMVGATFISSWNPDSFARMGNLEDGEYYITINHNTLVNPKPYGISAVSYTHLRAHETGRNLVCRLLLEKKKKKKHKS